MKKIKVQLELNFYDVVKLAQLIEVCKIPSLQGIHFEFDNHLNAKIAEAYLEQRFGPCSPIFHCNNSKSCGFVCTTMNKKMLDELMGEYEVIRKELADEMHFLLSTVPENVYLKSV